MKQLEIIYYFIEFLPLCFLFQDPLSFRFLKMSNQAACTIPTKYSFFCQDKESSFHFQLLYSLKTWMESILASIKALTQSFSHDRCNSNLRIHLYPRAHNHLIPRPCFQIYLDYYIFILPAISLVTDQFANFYSLLLSCLIFLLSKNL